MIDFADIPGWYGQDGPPDDYIPADLYLWTLNAVANVRFGWYVKSNGRPGLISLRPCRAMDLRGAAISTPGEPVSYRAPLQGTFWTWFEPFDRLHSHEATFENLAEAGGEVSLYVEAEADLAQDFRYARVYFNDHDMGNVFEVGGLPYPNRSTDTLVIPVNDFNARLLDGALTVRLEPCTQVYPVAGSRARMQLSYVTADVIHSTWGNLEVCCRHRAFGWRLNSRGRFEPYTFIQPLRDDGRSPYDGWPAVITTGIVSVIQPGVTGSGTPGRMAAILPFEMPPKQEALFESYPVVCGYETGIP